MFFPPDYKISLCFIPGAIGFHLPTKDSSSCYLCIILRTPETKNTQDTCNQRIPGYPGWLDSEDIWISIPWIHTYTQYIDISCILGHCKPAPTKVTGIASFKPALRIRLLLSSVQKTYSCLAMKRKRHIHTNIAYSY